MLRNIDNKYYCEVEDLLKSGKSQGYVKKVLNMFRKGESMKYANILDPTHTGRGSKRLIEIDSLPNELQARIKELLGLSSEAVKEVLELTNALNPANTTKIATEVVEQSIELSLPYIISKLESLQVSSSDVEEIQYLSKCDFHTASKWAYLRKVVGFYRKESLKLNGKDAHKTLRTLIVRSQAKSTKLLDSLPKLSKRVLLENPKELLPKNAGNKNASKLADDLLEWLKGQYAQGNRPKVSHIYERYNRIKEQKGWAQVTQASFYNWIKPFRVEADLTRKGIKQFNLINTITVNRKYPDNFGEVLSMDATPFNAWIWNEKKQKVYQSAWRCIAVDVASMYTTAKASQSKESPTLYMETFQMFVRQTGILPSVVEIDHFSGWQQFEGFLKFFGVELHVISTGNARAKLAEGVIGLQQSYIERYNKAFSGLNIDSADGKLSDEFMKIAQENRLTYNEAVKDIEEVTPAVWNSRILKQLNRKPCGKSPNQLRKELPTVSGKLSKEMYYRVAGSLHQVKVTIDGLVVHKEGIEYIFFPKMKADEIDKAADFFNRNMGQKMKVYVVDYEIGALVCDTDDRVIGYWERKQQVAYNPRLLGKDDKQYFASLRQLQQAQVRLAKESVERTRDYIEAGESFLKSHSHTGDKDLQMQMENLVKLGEDYVDMDTGEVIEEVASKKCVVTTYVDPDTGEIKEIRK